ncbi:MAG: hypothetical protein ACI8PT_003736 [Gammaproteobacteria bacterium]|jgi:hypothetical protein
MVVPSRYRRPLAPYACVTEFDIEPFGSQIAAIGRSGVREYAAREALNAVTSIGAPSSSAFSVNSVQPPRRLNNLSRVYTLQPHQVVAPAGEDRMPWQRVIGIASPLKHN